MSRYNNKKKTETIRDIDSLYDFNAKYELMRCITRVSITEYVKRTTTHAKKS
jgi:hypothetical protein